jgi:hypothetical protein
MGGSIDAQRQTAYNGQTRICNLKGDLFCALESIMRGSPRSDHTDGVFVAWVEPSPDVENCRGIMNLA